MPAANVSDLARAPERGLRRARTLWHLFRSERDDPAPFYRMLAAEAAADLDRRNGPLAGQTIADLGCGPGWYADAIRARGARVFAADGSWAELAAMGEPPAGASVADACRLPLADASVDGVFCSNLLEHTPDTDAVVTEMARVLKPGGWGYLSWTNWYSPWGGHDMTPWHLLGPERGPSAYERRYGPPRKNRYGEGLFAVHIGPTLRLFDEHPALAVDRVEPRYWPWARAVVRVPGLREVATWNCVVRFHKVRSPAASFAATYERLSGVEGWMTVDQARRLWDRSAALTGPATVVEIGSYRGRSSIVLATAASPGVHVVAIDPHAGNDRGPGQWEGTADEGEADHIAFLANVREAGVAGRVRHVRAFSQAALGEVDGEVDLLYIDGAHRYRPARADIEAWGDRVRPGGTMLIHDSFSSIGVTLAILRVLVLSGRWRYAGRSQSMTEYRRERVGGTARLTNAARQLAQLPWFTRNLAVKVLVSRGHRRAAGVLGHHQSAFPY